MRRAFVAALLSVACGTDDGPRGDEVRLWHTFGPDETAALNQALAGERVAATLLPYGTAQNRLRDVFSRAEGCPDLARVDATWIPAFAEAGWLEEAPAALLEDTLPEAIELTEWEDRRWGVPQTVDGLALIAQPGVDAPATLDDLDRLGAPFRTDGYWFVAYLRAAGGDIWDPATGSLGIDRPEARAALARYAAAVKTPAVADEAQRDAERFRGGAPVIVGGPWTLPALGGVEVKVLPYPRAPDGRPSAPRGGQVWVVPRCAKHEAAAWALAARLTAPELQAAWSRRLGTIPTRRGAVAGAGATAKAFLEALAATRPLPRDPFTPELFDDLTPAVQAVVLGGATADEALDGVARAWRRKLAAHRAPAEQR